MDVTKVTEYEEIDQLLPLIQKLYKELGIDKFLSISGYISWIVMNLPLANFQIWKGMEEGEAKGYLVAHITQRFLVKECVIIDAFIEENNPIVVDSVFNKILAWARENDCKQLSIISKRENAFKKKYGFESFGTIMIRKI